MGRLDGKVALVTGSARGIGKGIATVLASEGADVIVADLLIDLAFQTAGELQNRHGVTTMALEMDVTSEDSIATNVEQALSEMGRIDILVNNAGVAPDNLSENEVESDWDRCFEVNLKAIWKVSSALKPHFIENGGGKIVNIASIAARQGGYDRRLLGLQGRRGQHHPVAGHRTRTAQRQRQCCLPWPALDRHVAQTRGNAHWRSRR